jgi:hypothetical protein
MQKQLYAAIQTYSKNVGGEQIAFTKALYPYWYTDKNGNGTIEKEEIRPDNKYTRTTRRACCRPCTTTLSHCATLAALITTAATSCSCYTTRWKVWWRAARRASTRKANSARSCCQSNRK